MGTPTLHALRMTPTIQLSLSSLFYSTPLQTKATHIPGANHVPDRGTKAQVRSAACFVLYSPDLRKFFSRRKQNIDREPGRSSDHSLIVNTLQYFISPTQEKVWSLIDVREANFRSSMQLLSRYRNIGHMVSMLLSGCIWQSRHAVAFRPWCVHCIPRLPTKHQSGARHIKQVEHCPVTNKAQIIKIDFRQRETMEHMPRPSPFLFTEAHAIRNCSNSPVPWVCFALSHPLWKIRWV